MFFHPTSTKRFFCWLLLLYFLSNQQLTAQVYFRLIGGDTVAVFNNGVAPNLYQACRGTNITIQYRGLSNHPNRVMLTDKNGQLFNVGANFTSPSGGGSNHRGDISFTIPANAASGLVELRRGNNNILLYLPNLVIYNPEVDFLPEVSTICATNDTLQLLGIPSGGSFISPTPGLITGSIFDATQARWSSTQHDTVRTVSVEYRYLPTYSDGTPCASSIDVIKNLDVYDNRLTSLDFAPLVKSLNPALNTRLLTLDTTINRVVTAIEPNLLADATPIHPYNFSGTFVNGSGEFLGNVAGASNPVTLEFNNNGCIGRITTDLQVYEPIIIANLPDTLCKDASAVTFFGDSTLVYSFVSVPNGGLTIYTETNKIIGVETINPAHQTSINFVNTTGGNEEFTIDATLLPTGTQQVILSMLYRNNTSIEDALGNIILSRADTFQALDTVIIIPRPVLSIPGLAPAYCIDGSSDTVRPNPAFIAPSITSFTLVGADSSGVYNLPSSLFLDTILQPNVIYNALVPNSNRDLPLRLTYTVNQYGCTDNISANFTIRAPLEPSFLAKAAYCRNEAPSLLQRNVVVGGVREFFLPAPGLDTATGSFDPVLAGAGDIPVTYVLVDVFGCRYEFTDTLFVRQPPRIEMTLDGSRTNTSFCANPVSVPLRSRLLIGNLLDSIAFFGAGVIDSTFNPNSVFSGGGGTSIIWSRATDIFGCQGFDTLTVRIVQAPSIDIDTFFNNTPSNYGPGNNLRAEHTYCKSDDPLRIDGRPSYRDGTVVRGIITGLGVKLINTNYFYDPTQVAAGIEVDTVRYTYTDSIGCINTDLAIVKLDSIPLVSLNGFTGTAFCPNYNNVQLQGIPNLATAQGIALYSGPGVNPNSGLFTPATAGTGRKSIVYQFIDSKGCEDSDTVDIVVNPLPIPMFTGYQYQYCTADSADRLWSLNDTITGSYYFYGNIITDSIGILNANDSTTGPQNVYYAYVDSNNCTNVDSVNIFIHPTPDIQIYGLDSAYCYNAPSDIITVVPAGSGGSLISSDTAFSTGVNTIILTPNLGRPGIKSFVYGYTDNNGCENNIQVRTYVHRPVQPSVIGLSLFQCATNDTIPIRGIPNWGTFRGPGIIADTTQIIDSIWSFIPSATNIGTRTIIYSVDDTLNGYILGNGQPANLVCAADSIMTINVRQLPNPKFSTPTNNTRFCSNDNIIELKPDSLNPVWHAFRDTSGGVSFTTDSIYVPVPGGLFDLVEDTTFYFDPHVVGPGIHSITYIATDTTSYCQDSIQLTYIIDQYIPVDFSLDSVYCASNPSVLLVGTPAGGLFTRNNLILNPNRQSPFFTFDINLTATINDTLTYAIEYGACEDTLTKVIEINPIPQISFTTINFPHNTYCLGGADVVLNTTTTGGSFDGSPGVLAGRQTFVPDLAGVGSHRVTLAYMDSSTSCSNTFSDTLHVYGMPNLDFTVDGGCQFDTVYFKPNNAILGLRNTFQNRIIDSITSVQWIFSPTYTTAGSSQSNLVDSNLIDTIGYSYNAAGVYLTQLIIANRVYCIDTQIVRLVISPKVNTFPYEQDFETTAGDWYAESRDSSHRLLWEWGTDNTPAGIPADANNHIWATQTNGQYNGDEDAWVYSPCFDLTTLDRPMVSFDYWSDTRASVDGTVIEYQRPDGTWAPVGFMERGVNWFNSPFISGQPGDQYAANLLGTGWTAPLGWSGENQSWQNGRYKLDDFRGNDNTLRMRIAFASPAIQPNDFYDGFAFDNVVVRNRTRNVLLETMSNGGFTNMEVINNGLYQLIFHTPINKDVVLLQYQMENPNTNDFFYLHNPVLGRNRAYEYGGSPAGRAFIDGDDSTTTYVTEDLTDADFEQDMLASPKFEVEIDTFIHVNNTFTIKATVTAIENMPMGDYRIYTVISEDSLSYPSGFSYRSQMHAIARENDQYHLNPSVNTTQIFNQSWTPNTPSAVQQVNFTWNHSGLNFISYSPQRFQAVVFIQNTDTKEVFQVATSRDVAGYWVGVEPIQAAAALNEIQTMNLFPNPAHDYFNVKFDQALENDYQWKLVDMRGVEIRQGEVRRGAEQLTVDGLDCPSGAYIMLLYNDQVFVQRKVVLGRP